MVQPATRISVQVDGQKRLSSSPGRRFTQRKATVSPAACTVTQSAIKHNAVRSFVSISE